MARTKDRRMAGHWNTEYYDNLEYFFWEPQHLGRMKNPNSKIQSVHDAVRKLRRMEVCLNHQMNLFFRLAPKSYQVEFFEACFGTTLEDDWTLIGREFDKLWNVQNVTQPDIFFAGQNSSVGVELKLGSKLTLEQVLKYAVLSIHEQAHFGAKKDFYLLFMGRGEFENQWKERFPDIESMKTALSSVRLSETGKSWAKKFDGRDEEILEAARNTKFGFMNYETFAITLSKFNQSIDLASPYATTISELFNGMSAELRERELAIVG
jgi:hypothetical protein